jgi:hypothetical protein
MDRRCDFSSQRNNTLRVIWGGGEMLGKVFGPKRDEVADIGEKYIF